MARFAKGSKEAKAYMSKIRKKKTVSGTSSKVKKQTGTSNRKIDKLIQAKKPGKRLAKGTKNVYYESRANRSDKGVLLGIGAVKKDLSTKYQTALKNIAYLTGEIAMYKVLLSHAAAVEKPKKKKKIKGLQLKLKYAKKLKSQLSKFK